MVEIDRGCDLYKLMSECECKSAREVSIINSFSNTFNLIYGGSIIYGANDAIHRCTLIWWDT